MAEDNHTDQGVKQEQVLASEDLDADEKQFTCGICIEHYTTPRYLPKCGHTFCERCLFTYASNQHEQGSELECPVCRKSYNLPGEVTLEWIQTFPLNSALVKMTEFLPQTDEEVKEEGPTCDPCKDEGETTLGTKICLDCKETLCDMCARYHKKFKAFKHHQLADVADISAKGACAEILKDFTMCTNHKDREVEFHCETHDFVLCAVCLITDDHKQCNVREISHLDLDAAKIRNDSEKLTRCLQAMEEYLTELQVWRKEMKKSFEFKLKDVRKNMEHFRNRMVQLMDQLVQHVTDLTKQTYFEYENSLDKDMLRVKRMKEQLQQKSALQDTIMQHGSEKHKFVVGCSGKEQCQKMEEAIYKEYKLLKKTVPELNVAESIRKLTECSDVAKLADVTLNEIDDDHRPYSITLNYLGHSKLNKRNDHEVYLYPINYAQYSSVALHRDQRVILVDYRSEATCGYLCLYNPTNQSKQTLKLNQPFYATQLGDAHIAVTIPMDKAISIVHIGTDLKVEKTLKTQNEPKCVFALRNGLMAVSWSDPAAFSMINIEGTDIVQKMHLDHDKRGRKFNSIDYFAVDESRNHIIQVCHKDKAIYCFDFTGEPIFSFTNPRMANPKGIALDKCSNIYVCECQDPGSIFKLSPTGELISIITEGIPKMVTAICIGESDTGFWTSQNTDTISFFQLEPSTVSWDS